MREGPWNPLEGSGGGKLVTVGIADLRISSQAKDVLITYALGSCVAVVVYDPLRKVGGMLHFMLPESKIASAKAKAQPAMFGDTGVPLLFEGMQKLGVNKGDLVIRLVGAATFYNSADVFDVGRRNQAIVRKIFTDFGLRAKAEDMGGSESRTVRLVLGNGKTFVKTPHGEREL